MKVEKFIPRRINKDLAPDAIDRGNDRKFLPGDLLDALNCCYESDGSDGIIKNRKGNVLRPQTLPDGANKVLGSFKDEARNVIYVLLWNVNNNDRVFEYAIDTNTFTTLLAGDLKFEKEYMIAQGGVIDDILLWNDALNRPRSISITKAKAGGYTAPYSEFEISLATLPPLREPTVARSTDATLPLNNLTAYTWQITHRYVYHDNRMSTIGPYSKLMWIRPFVDVNDTANNELTITIPFPIELAGIVSRVEVIAREGNTNNHYIFDEIKNPALASYQVKFNNFGKKIVVPISETTRLYDYIPDRTEGFEVLKDRVFTVLNNVGFDVDESTFDFTVTLKTEAAPHPTFPPPPYTATSGTVIPNTPLIRDGSYNNKRYLKAGGSYVVALVFEDDFGKMSFVKKQKKVVVPFTQKMGYYGNRYYMECALSGTPPAGISKYKFVISEELFYDSYFQTRLFPLLYIREIGVDEPDNTELKTDVGKYTWQGKLFYDMLYENTVPNEVDQAGVKYLYWQLPVNSPFVPDASYFVRFSTDFATNYVPVLGVVGSYLVTEFEPFRAAFKTGSPVLDTGFTFAPGRAWQVGVMAEVFKIKESSNPAKFYEIGDTYNTLAGAFTTTVVTLCGDTYNVNLLFDAEYIYDWVKLAFENDSSFTGEVHSASYENVLRGREKLFIESPTGIFSATAKPTTVVATSGRTDETASTGVAEETFYKSSLDYAKRSSDQGRVHTVFDQEKKRDLYNVVGFSNPYVENTFINGLNSFLADNQYPLPVERSRTRTLKRAGDVMVAIHQTQTSTLYIGEGFIRQNQDFILAKTDGVVGDDRKLQGGFGTINPESVKEIYDDLYWWDALRGAVVRQTKAGLFPISNFGMRNYFFLKAKELEPYRNELKIVSGFDASHDEFLISFPDVRNDADTIIIPGVTWAFNVRSNEWKTRFSFNPDCYASVNQNFITFKNGALWVHFENSLCNNYYGVQYNRSFKTVVNGQLGKNKRFLNVHIKGALCQDPTGDFVPVRVYNQEGQESFTPAYEFELDEGKWNGPILKDVNTPNMSASQLALRSGDDIVSNYLEVEVFNDRTDSSPCSQVNVIYNEEEFSI